MDFEARENRMIRRTYPEYPAYPEHLCLTRRLAIVCLAPLISVLIGSAARAQICDDNAAIAVGNVVGTPGQQVTVELRGKSLCEVTGLGMAIGHDSSRVQFLSAEPSPFVTGYAGGSLVFLAEEHNDKGFMSMFWVFDLGFGETIPPRSIPANTVLTLLTYSILPNATGQVNLVNESRTYGSPRIENIFTTDTTQILPSLSGGTITVGSSTPSRFRRSDANGDGNQDLADAIFVLSFLFGGAQPPACTKAADVNDSGTVDLSDPVFMLNFYFSGGRAPAAPFRQCGLDPTPDGLGCAFFPSC